MPTDLDVPRKACDGLLYPSETDGPIRVVYELEGQGTAREALKASGTGELGCWICLETLAVGT